MADIPPTTLVAGGAFCFRVYEYVPHTGMVMKVDLSRYPEGPMGVPENFNLHLAPGFDQRRTRTRPMLVCMELQAEQYATDL